MLFKKFQQLAQWVGFLAIAGLALYGLVNLGSGRLWAAGDESRRAATDIVIPSTFNYQGFLRDGQGNPMGGTHKITLKLWKDVLATDVPALHSENFPAVSVRDGLFNVVIGSLTTLDTNLFVNNVPVFVGVSVDDGAELLPRQRIHPVPWAILATSAQNATTAGTATTLVSDASVSNLKLNGTTRFRVGGATEVYEDSAGTMVMNGGSGFYFGGNAYFNNNVNVGNNLNVASGMFLNGKSPVLIKRINNYQLANNNPGTIPTGIMVADYRCTMAGWDVSYDVKEGSTGRWGRHLYTIDGEWHVYMMNHVDNSALKVNSVDVVCFKHGIVEYQFQDGNTRDRAGTTPSDSDPLAAPTEQE